MSTFVRKTIVLNQDLIDKARKIFGSRTEKDAVNKALELAVAEDEIIEAHKIVGGKGEVKEAF